MDKHDSIIEDYTVNLLTFKELSSKYHMGQDSLRKVLKEYNIPIFTNQESRILRLNKGKTLYEIEQKVIYNYSTLGYGQKKSGEEFNIGQDKVKSILKKYNIPIRNFGEAAVLSNKREERGRKYQVNNNFFAKESRNMAWLLGFLASDGNVRKDRNCIRIELSYIDEEILQRIKEIVGIENPISFREDKKGRKFVKLAWFSKQQKDDLARYSIVPNKTNILQPPYTLSHKYALDYIRGYFDGDGTININMCHGGTSKAIRFGICGASKPVLDWIVDIFEEYGIKRVNPHLDSSHENPFWTIVYSSNASREIYKLLYYDIDDTVLFLKRKKDKYERILEEVPKKE